MTVRRARRGGLTLIELLVVISVLVVLATIATVAAFRATGGQKRAATEATVRKLHALLEQKWKTVVDECGKEARKMALPSQLADFCGEASVANKNKTYVVYTYMRLANEFPTTFDEATNDVTVTGTSPAVAFSLPKKAAFTSAFDATAANLPIDPEFTPADDKFIESAACLYQIIAGGGQSLDGLEGQVGTTPSVASPRKQYRCFKDGWGKPIGFVRMAYASELNAAPYINTNAATGRTSNDPFDPKSQLGDTTAFPNLDAFWTGVTGRHLKYNAPTLGGVLPTAVTAYPTTNAVRNWTFAIVSSGGTGAKAGVTSAFGADPFGVSGGAEDNVVSYRLVAEKKGF